MNWGFSFVLFWSWCVLNDHLCLKWVFLCENQPCKTKIKTSLLQCTHLMTLSKLFVLISPIAGPWYGILEKVWLNVPIPSSRSMKTVYLVEENGQFQYDLFNMNQNWWPLQLTKSNVNTHMCVKENTTQILYSFGKPNDSIVTNHLLIWIKNNMNDFYKQLKAKNIQYVSICHL